MMEPKIILIGLVGHFAIQIYSGLKSDPRRPSSKILWTFIFSFFLIGILLTVLNLNSIADFGTCGTKRFNPLTMISFWGNAASSGEFDPKRLKIVII